MLRLNIKTIPKTWFILFIIVIFLGTFFRITNIENKGSYSKMLENLGLLASVFDNFATAVV